MYSYDFVHVLVGRADARGLLDPKKVLAALNQVTTQGANGDERASTSTTTRASSTTTSTSRASTT